MLKHIREREPSESLVWLDLTCRAAAPFMIFTPGRPVGMWRINPDRDVYAADGQSVSVPVKEKTDHGRGTSILTTKPVALPNLCTVRCYRPLRRERSREG
jgi:hypothetical protein